jgi:hypothetical protein
MKRLFKFLFPICFHNYEIENKQELSLYNLFEEMSPTGLNDATNKYKNPIGIKYTLKCKKCGEIKTYYDCFRYD